MRKVLLCLLLTTGLLSKAQVYNNEWIDYSKTYYKFKLKNSGLYRIPQTILSSAGLSNSPAEYFQLWRNGVQVPIYTSIPTGIFSSSDYIEFWGQQNDGGPDRELYPDPNFQLNTKVSLETDTSTYFLTVNPVPANNLRLQNTPNNISGNSLPVEPYFMHTTGKYFTDQLNSGYAVNVGEYLYSSTYDKGEGFTSADIALNSSLAPFTFQNLYPYNGGPSAQFKIAVFGNAVNIRQYQASINSSQVITKEVDFFNTSVDSVTIPYSLISSGSATINVANLTGCNTPPNCPTYDALDVAFFEITYPRKFDFGGLANFEFNLPASGSGNFLQITDFTYGGTAPVLYDLTNGTRYVADMSSAPTLQFVLQPSATKRHLVLLSEDNSNINTISSLQTRNFINYTNAANQGDYIIISNPVLYNGGNGSNPVDDYRAYRSSSAGGGYNAKIFNADELIDQFGFGINRNPAGIRDFLYYARNKFAVKPKFVFLIGKGVCYNYVRENESDPNMNALALVPTFGYPASDGMLTADPGSSQPLLPVGRLSVINAGEVSLYLKKVKDQEQAQATLSPRIEDRGWMKNVVHITGTSEPGLQAQLDQHMSEYRKIIIDTLFGANVTSFSKTSADEVDQINSSLLKNLFAEGISLITYFGHSSSTTLEFNLDNPQNYNNYGKYPLFIGLGCNAGNFFDFNLSRLQVNETLSERYVLSKDRGTIGFIASTYFGIVQYLDIWNSRAYINITSKSYGKSIGEIMMNTAKDVFDFTTQQDFIARCNVEQSELHGDPAVKINPQPKPDYVIEDQMVKVSPGFVSIGDRSFKLDAKFLNIGKAVNTNIVIEVKRTYPNQKVVTVLRDTIPGIRYADSISVNIPINPLHDKGLNRITVTVDADNAVDEIFETNNSISKDVMIYENEATPIYPYDLSIVNKQNIKLVASTANPFSPSKQYHMELDTTMQFNSTAKVAKVLTSAGGILEFDPQTTFRDSTVYYWRVAPDTTGTLNWNNASFVFISGSDPGFNQSHYYQHIHSTSNHILLDSPTRHWVYDSLYNSLFVKNGVFYTATNQAGDLVVSVNGEAYIRSACVGFSLIFNVFDPRTFKPWVNTTGRFGSALPCDQYKVNNFEWSYMDPANRKLAMNFMDSIPVGSYVVVRNILNNFQTNNFAKDWQADTSLYGKNNSLYHKLKAAGFAGLDAFDSPKAFALIYQKGASGFTPIYSISQGMYDEITLSTSIKTPDSTGTITSPQFGPASAWKQVFWSGTSDEAQSHDWATVDVLGIKTNGTADTLIRALTVNQQKADISSINAKQYPFIQLHLHDMDSVSYTPYQLKSWRVTCVPAPEGALAPNLYFHMKDTFDIAEPFDFKIAFKNVSDVGFDSIKVKLMITDRNNVQHVLPITKVKPLTAGDTVIIHYPIDTRQIVGANSLYIEVNPNNDQIEQYHFNNYAYKSFYVRGDTLNPLLDVTFDNVHILNNDIVSAKPGIVIQLKDDAKWNLLNDPSVIHVQVRFPDGSLHPYSFGTDTLQFVPAQQANSNKNTASAIFKPNFAQDGTYTLIVSGQDMSQNQAGSMQYQVNFQVINKPMISNMLNYPNPFTSSTAFVFTVTGSQVPQNIKIQILTITGKIVREITKEELGPIHVGRNITDFKWDGTDQFGQKLGRGVYLYHVVTNLNGKALDKYISDSDNTNHFFIQGYGKMYYLGAN